MYELIQVGDQSYYINSPTKIGIYRQNDTDVYIIDSGNDKDAGRRLRKILEENQWILKGIINTHSHADHIGGNKYLQGQTGCKVFASEIESAFTEHPILEPSYLFGGYPPKDLRHKFLMANPSITTPIDHEEFPKELEVINLSGHFFNMIGIKTPDETVFLADCVSSEKTLEKYQIPAIYNVENYLKTLDKVEKLAGKVFVPAHTEVTEDISQLVKINRDKVYQVAEKILEITKCEITFEELLKKLFDSYGLTLSIEQYVLVGSTVKSFLAWLKDQGKLETVVKDNYLYWCQV